MDSAVSLLQSIQARLQQSAAEPTDLSAQLRCRLLECIADLNQLHSTLISNGHRGRQLALQVVSAQSKVRRAQFLADCDSLTSLPNRRAFLRRLEQALAYAKPRGQPLAVLYLDVDQFKRINDTHGHEVGDKLLRVIAARLSRSMRGEDIVSRLGGDEFCCLLGGEVNHSQLQSVALKLLKSIATPIRIGEISLSISTSIGIAVFPHDAISCAGLLKNADAAMYQAKRQASGFSFFEQCRALPTSTSLAS